MKTPLDILKEKFGYHSFREPQEEIIKSVCDEKDTFVLLPTGGGKSLCYQIPMLQKEGIGLVISPLIALMEDQVAQLQEKDIPAVSFSGVNSREETYRLLDNCLYKAYKIMYVSPEKIIQPWFLERLVQLPINCIAVDEAHCVSQWGHDFRPAYLHIAKIRAFLPQVPVIALTASANKRVQADIKNLLKLKNPAEFHKSVARPEISYVIEETEAVESRLLELFSKQFSPAIVYVRSRQQTIEWANRLNNLGIKTAFFHGGMSFREKKVVLQNWLDEEKQVVVATNAFGMGVDKPNVRFVIHLQIPENIESYYQEAGRAGRDKKESKALLMYNDRVLNQFKLLYKRSLIEKEYFKKVYQLFMQYHQIAYGEGEGRLFVMNFSEFCNKYQLELSKTYHIFQFFDRQGIFTIDQKIQYTSTIYFCIDNQSILEFLKNNPLEENLFLYIVQNYRNVSQLPTQINVKKIARDLMCGEEVILGILNTWKNKGICEFSNQTNDLHVILNEIRQDDYTLNPRLKYIQKHNELKRNQFEEIFRLIINKEKCISATIAKYFGEEITDCGKCSVCNSKKNNEEELSYFFDNLQVGESFSITEILEKYNTDIEKIQPYIDQLMMKKRLVINNNKIIVK